MCGSLFSQLNAASLIRSFRFHRKSNSTTFRDIMHNSVMIFLPFRNMPVCVLTPDDDEQNWKLSQLLTNYKAATCFGRFEVINNRLAFLTGKRAMDHRIFRPIRFVFGWVNRRMLIFDQIFVQRWAEECDPIPTFCDGLHTKEFKRLTHATNIIFIA